jgi:hypothetical protein
MRDRPSKVDFNLLNPTIGDLQNLSVPELLAGVAGAKVCHEYEILGFAHAFKAKPGRELVGWPTAAEVRFLVDRVVRGTGEVEVIRKERFKYASVA